MSAPRLQYIVDTDRLNDAERVAACESAIDVISVDAASFETDIPWGNADHWPADVVEAAERLQNLSTKRRKDANYGQTGVLQVAANDIWLAFRRVAPRAFDAGVWARDHEQLLSLSDESQSIVVSLTDTQLQEFASVVPADRLIPWKGWKARSLARRMAQIRALFVRARS